MKWQEIEMKKPAFLKPGRAESYGKPLDYSVIPVKTVSRDGYDTPWIVDENGNYYKSSDFKSQ